ncbi:MAG TPA: acyl-homoserine-lactone synthase [Rhizobiaceae bacterium]|nr:acyl-homoserine-lactone synthase [Rhizobiaceae bacterium]
MRVHVVTVANRDLYRSELLAFFRERHRVYVEEKHWREGDGSGLEIDQFDTDDATYLIGIQNGRVMTGTRLISTMRPHMASEVFPHLCNLHGVVRSPQIAEWTRGFIIPEYRERGIGPIKGQFCSAVMDYCLQEGIKRVGGIQDLYWLRLWKHFGWKVIPAGHPTKVDGRWCVIAYMEVSEAARDGAMRSGAIERSILVRKGPARPFCPAILQEVSNA